MTELTCSVHPGHFAMAALEKARRHGKPLVIRNHKGTATLYAGGILVGRIVEQTKAAALIGRQVTDMGSLVLGNGRTVVYLECPD